MPSRNYHAEQIQDHGADVVRLTDVSHGIEVSVFPAVGNRAYKMLVRGQNVLHFPFEDPNELRSDRHLNGIPFLAPWANRMPDGFYANGNHYPFNMGSASIRPDGNGIPIHGLLTASPFWTVKEISADSTAASVTSCLEFWRHPELMSNWPIAHEYEMTYRLADGALEVAVSILNRSTDPMPVAVGFHPYFTLPGVPIREATARIPVTRHVETDSRLVPTGATSPISFKNPVSLRDHHFDDGFTGLTPGAFIVEGAGRKIEVTFGLKYTVAIVYAPPASDFICFEPMATITNGINLAHEGKYPAPQSIAPGDRWAESFWIRPGGF